MSFKLHIILFIYLHYNCIYILNMSYLPFVVYFVFDMSLLPSVYQLKKSRTERDQFET